MARKRHTAEEIVTKLRQVDVLVSQGRPIAEAWSTLSPATRRQRENIFLHVIGTAGQKPFARIDAAAIRAGRERRAATPAQARNFLDAMRGLFRWATKAGLVKIDH